MKENIWGKEGCLLPNGKLCTACCVLPNIELEGSFISIGKPENTPCPHLNQLEGGCSLHLNGKPDTCRNWHCSKAGNDYKLELITGGLALGLVNSDQAVRAASNWTNKEISEVRNQIENEANSLIQEIKSRELIYGDLMEP